MPASSKTAQAPLPTMVEAYFLKKVAKPFDWVVLGVGEKPATYRMEVIGVEDGVLHMGIHRMTIENWTGKKIDPRQLDDVCFDLADKLTRDEVLDRVAVMADQAALTRDKNWISPRLIELLRATGLGHLHRYAA